MFEVIAKNKKEQLGIFGGFCSRKYAEDCVTVLAARSDILTAQIVWKTPTEEDAERRTDET